MSRAAMAAKQGAELARAYRRCAQLARGHYENFPVASLFIPKEMRRHIYAIYAFCRYTDDLGDEAEGDCEARLLALDRWEEELERCYRGEPSYPIMAALAETIRKFDLPKEPFLKLIEANRMDQRKRRYRTYEELLHYCDHSANPVGRLFLHLFGYCDEERLALADKTCTALQLTNFWQDIALDLEKGRIYIPEEDMARFDYSEEELGLHLVNASFKRLMEFELSRTRGLFREGLELVKLVDGRLKVAIALFSGGGLAILEKIEETDYDIFRHRPRLSKLKKLGLLRAILNLSGNES